MLQSVHSTPHLIIQQECSKNILEFFWGIFLAEYIRVIHDQGNSIGGFALGDLTSIEATFLVSTECP